MAEVSFPVSSVGLVIPFVVTEGGQPLTHPLSASVTWINNRGTQRHLTLESPVSSEWTWTTSAGEFRSPHQEEGYLVISYYTNVFYVGPFRVNVTGHFHG